MTNYIINHSIIINYEKIKNGTYKWTEAELNEIITLSTSSIDGIPIKYIPSEHTLIPINTAVITTISIINFPIDFNTLFFNILYPIYSNFLSIVCFHKATLITMLRTITIPTQNTTSHMHSLFHQFFQKRLQR